MHNKEKFLIIQHDLRRLAKKAVDIGLVTNDQEFLALFMGFPITTWLDAGKPVSELLVKTIMMIKSVADMMKADKEDDERLAAEAAAERREVTSPEMVNALEKAKSQINSILSSKRGEQDEPRS